MIKLPKKFDYIIMHPELEIALDALINTDDNLCIIGEAGCGKTEFIKICSDKQVYNKNVIVATPTGISAVNASSDGVRATTIHSLFQLKPLSIIPPEQLVTHAKLAPIFRNLDCLVIDEISMVNSDLLSKIVYLLKSNRNETLPRIIVIGDPSQLAPIIETPEEQDYINDMYRSRYFFHASIFKSMKILQFSKVFRQKDKEFSTVLGRFRYKKETDADRKYLNSRVMSVEEFRKGGDFVHIALTNRTVNDINSREMSMNPNRSKVYYGRDNNFKDAPPVEERLVLKVGAQIMLCINNKTQGYYNGMLGRVTKLNPETVEVSTDRGTFLIEPFTWEKYTYKYDKETKKIRAVVTGSFRQLPIRIAYALTSHKCQGLTLDRMYLDLERGTFASGMCYTACSRSRTIEGFGLKRAIKASDNKLSMVIRKFYARHGIGGKEC
jgi:ATP-dependent DNA helicase PIF1